MRQFNSIKIISVLAALALTVFAIAAVAETLNVGNVEEYFLTVGDEQLHFIAQPESGYVLKTRYDIGSMETLSRFLKSTGDIKISPVSGLGRKGVSVVYNERPAEENSKTIKSLRVHSEVQYAAPLFSSNGETVAVIPEIVIRVKPGTEIEQVETICETAGCTIIKRMEFTEQEYLLEVSGPDAEAVFEAAGQLNQIDWIEWAAPNTAFRPKLFSQAISGGLANNERLLTDAPIQDANNPGVLPNDEYFPMQWHLHNTGQSGGTPGADIRAPEAWEITTGDSNIVIAVIDVGVDSSHPDLIGNLVSGYDFYENDDRPDPSHDVSIDAHDTACAGLIAAQGNNELGVTGVAYNSNIMPIRDGDATSFITQAEEASAFRWAAVHGADVFSFSTVLKNVPILHSALQDVTRLGGIGREGKGCVALFAAGNSGQSIKAGRTATYTEVITVGATDHNDQSCWYSNYGPELDVTAPGGGGIVVPNFVEMQYVEEYARLSKHLLWTTDIIGETGFSRFNENPNMLDYTEKFSGTSGATPVAAGVAALILSIEPNLTSDEVRHFLEHSAKDLGEPGWDQYYGWGRVDARAALDMVLAKRADLNNDWKVDMEDLLILIEFWRTGEPSADIAPAAKRDGIVDEQDLELMMRYWQMEIPEMNPTAQ